MKKYVFLIFFLLLFIMPSTGQSINNKKLVEKTYESLTLMFDINRLDTIKAKQIASAYVFKAKKESDSTQIANGYVRLATISKPYKALKYLDTTIVYSKNSKSKIFPALGYLTKSQYFFNNNEYEKSLKNAIIAYEFAEKKNNIDQQLTAIHQINAVNELWGDYKKVLETEFFAYDLISKNPNIERFNEHYLYSVEGIGKCYARLKKPDSALIYFKKGIVKSLKEHDSITYLAFVSRTGMALYAQSNYKRALDSLEKGDLNREMYNKNYLPYYFYYVGSSLYNLKQKEKAISYFKKIDSIYENEHILSPELPLAYDKLISYFQEKNEKELQLEYLYKLIRVERIIDVKRSRIIEKTDSDYHIPKMIKEKEALIADLSEQNKNNLVNTWWILSFLSVSLLTLAYYIRRQIQFKKRFNSLINQQKSKKNKSESDDGISNGISIEIIEEILNHLNKFEINKVFLSTDISLRDVAISFETNSSYLSKVINLKKDKNFSQYISDLRIDYITKQLESDPLIRRYTIKAIAAECGYKNAESFSRAFYKKHGIYPSYYIKQLENKE